MKLLVFGATGTIGRQVVDQALAEGHEITAFTRNSSRLEDLDPRLQVVQGLRLSTQYIALTKHSTTGEGLEPSKSTRTSA